MGLTVHYGINSKSKSVRDIKSVLAQLRHRAMDLPFHSVSEIYDLKGDECDYEKQRGKVDDGLHWALCGVGTSVEISRREERTASGGKTVYSQSLPVNPKRIIGFIIYVGDGCEPMNIFFATYPNTVLYPPKSEVFYWRKSRRYPVERKGWTAHGFCKTQYANDPECGGLRHFLRCHISVITLLEFAQTLPNVEVEINDEGKYGTSYYTDDWRVPEPIYTWHPAKHSVEELAKEVGEWDAMIAAGAGAFKDLLVKNGENPDDLKTAMDNRPDREHLEAKGVEAQPEIRTNLGLPA